MRHFAYVGICALGLMAAIARAQTQSGELAELALPDAPIPAVRQSVPRVPGVGSLLNGANAGVSLSSVHSSVVGWYGVAVPAVSYTFSPHLSADLSLPLYLHRLVRNSQINETKPQSLVLDALAAGDTQLAVHGYFHGKNFEDVVTLSALAPTGKRSEGLGTGRVTFDFDNDLGRSFGATAFNLDLGMGDSSGLANNLLLRDYNSLGALAHFQTSASRWILGRALVQASAYEQLPIGDQKIYMEMAIRSMDSGQVFYMTQAEGNGISEDNGLTVSTGIPLSAHLMFSGYYNRSLRQRQDTVSLGVTYLWHNFSYKRHGSMIERALREAAGLPPE